jgi:hypothetical protein
VRERVGQEREGERELYTGCGEGPLQEPQDEARAKSSVGLFQLFTCLGLHEVWWLGPKCLLNPKSVQRGNRPG